MEVGDVAPDFELEANDGTNVRLKSFAGQNNVVLCFYPKNHLFACPSKKVFDMAKSVISVYGEILATNSKLFAISIDTVDSQKKFVEEYNVSIPVRNIQVLTLLGLQSAQLSSLTKMESSKIFSETLM